MRKTDAERKRDQRKRDAAREAAERAKLQRSSREEFWQTMRARDAKLYDFAALQLVHETVWDQIFWMDNCDNPAVNDPEDENYVSLEEGEDNLDDFVREHGVIHLGYIYRDPILRGSSWHEYWKDAATLEKICNEGGPTKGYALYGLLTGIPDWMYLEFKNKFGKKPRVDIGQYCDTYGTGGVGGVFRYR
jgi:hypothetical protein